MLNAFLKVLVTIFSWTRKRRTWGGGMTGSSGRRGASRTTTTTGGQRNQRYVKIKIKWLFAPEKNILAKI